MNKPHPLTIAREKLEADLLERVTKMELELAVQVAEIETVTVKGVGDKIPRTIAVKVRLEV